MLKEVKNTAEESLDTFHYPSSNQQQQQKDVQYKAPSISDDEVEKLLSGLPEVVLSNVLKEWRKRCRVRHGKNAITNEDIASIIRKLTIMTKENAMKPFVISIFCLSDYYEDHLAKHKFHGRKYTTLNGLSIR